MTTGQSSAIQESKIHAMLHIAQSIIPKHKATNDRNPRLLSEPGTKDKGRSIPEVNLPYQYVLLCCSLLYVFRSENVQQSEEGDLYA